MGFLTTIGTALGFINSNDTASALAKDISSGVDMMVYTDEEKAIDKAKMTVQSMEAWLRMVEMMKSSEVYRSVTRRAIALFFVFNIWCLIWLCVWLETAAAFHWIDMATSAPKDGVALTLLTWTVLKIAGVFQLGWALCTIIVFYFGPQLVQMMKGKGK